MQLIPFQDSSDLLLDGDALSKRLSEDGYLFIRGLIPRESVITVRSRLLNIASEANWLKKHTQISDALVDDAFDFKTVRGADIKYLHRMWCDEALHRLRTHANVLSLFDRIFNEPTLVHPNFFLRNYFPKDVSTDSHQDKMYVGGGDFCTMWVPLGDYPVEQGVLAVAFKSHTQGIRKAKFFGMGILEDFSGQWVSGDVRAGDVLIFNNLTVHKSLVNQTNKLRQSFDARYQAASQTLTQLSITPGSDSGCLDWESVYANWKSKDMQFYWRAFDLKVVPLSKTPFEIDYPAAFKIAQSGDLSMRESLLRLI